MGEERGATGNEQLNLSFAVAGCRQRFCLCRRRRRCRCLPDKIAADSLSDKMLTGRSYRASRPGPVMPAQICLHTCPMCNCLGASNHWPPLPSSSLPLPSTCQKHFFLPLLSVQHVTDTIEMENDMQHDTSSHGSTRATATTTRSAIS